MKINKPTEEKVDLKVEVGDLVEYPNGIVLVAHKEDTMFPYVLVNIESGEIVNSYAQLSTFDNDFNLQLGGTIKKVYKKSEITIK